MKKIKKRNIILTSIVMVIVCAVAYFVPTYLNSKQTAQTLSETRTIEVKQAEIDYQRVFDEFEDAKLETEGSLTTFEGVKTFNLADLEGIDLVTDTDVEEDLEMQVKYKYSYDNETNMVTLEATLVGDDGEPLIDRMYGVAFVNEDGNLDAVFDCDDGEYMLLSEMQDLGMIENCGWFKNAWKKIKKVCSTKVGVVCAVATVALPVLTGIIGACVAAPLAATIAVGAGVGAMSSALGAGFSTIEQDGKVDWEAVGICAGVGAAVGALSSAVSYKITSAIKSLFPKANPSTNVKSFNTYYDFKKEYGKASDYITDGEWHHIVEQQTVDKGINAGTSVYNSQNTVAISKNLHQKISGYYSRIYQEGKTFREFVNTLSYEEQYTKGLEILKMFAEQLGETIIWL